MYLKFIILLSLQNKVSSALENIRIIKLVLDILKPIYLHSLVTSPIENILFS